MAGSFENQEGYVVKTKIDKDEITVWKGVRTRLLYEIDRRVVINSTKGSV